ncbi:hypothetical protein ACEWY4_013824 [Coilia grayii]|uniref:Caveolin n=1 Tax=Coilia grayii TaxID=363190 RepID=A0ABD1JXJ4_9TELE
MDRTDSPAETRIDLEGIEQQLRTELWEQPGVYFASGAEEAAAPEERGPGQGQAEEEGGLGGGVPASSSPSSRRPPMIDRDPRGLPILFHCSPQQQCPEQHQHIVTSLEAIYLFPQVNFEDVIAEPPSVRSFDKVWLWSHALFEVSRLWFYRLISLLLAVPVSLVAGILFAILSCLHIWLIMPCVQLSLINMHWIKVVWGSVLDILIAPLCSSLGKCCGAINIHIAKD